MREDGREREREEAQEKEGKSELFIEKGREGDSGKVKKMEYTREKE